MIRDTYKDKVDERVVKFLRGELRDTLNTATALADRLSSESKDPVDWQLWWLLTCAETTAKDRAREKAERDRLANESADIDDGRSDGDTCELQTDAEDGGVHGEGEGVDL